MQVNFEKLNFEVGKREEFEKFVKIKGEFLYKQIYDILLDCGDTDVKYKELSSVIRYDKSLRDKLYIYLSTFEENLRSIIFEKFDVSSGGKAYKNTEGLKRLKIDIHLRNYEQSSNLYFRYRIDLGKTVDLLDCLNVFDSKTIEDFKTIVDLRNDVMHHNLLLFGTSVTKKDACESLISLRKKIMTLRNHLPEEYRKGFTDTINNDIGKRFLDRLYLEEI